MLRVNVVDLSDFPDWPGKTPPKNRPHSIKRTPPAERYNGAKPKTYRMAGVDKELFTVGEVAKALGRKAITIRMWENRGWIPKSTYRTPAPQGEQIPGKPSKGRRLYSVDQLLLLIESVENFKLDDPTQSNWDGFRNHIKANWPRA